MPVTERLARNLKAAIEASDLSAPEVAKRAGVDRKTVNNMLNGRFDSQVGKIESVARVFGLTAEELIADRFDPYDRTYPHLRVLIEDYASTDDEGRDSILKTAAMARRARPRAR